MDLQPLYDVKSRLEQAAIAGTGLLAEDFRLRRAGEELKPLAAASPVFGKIHQGLAGLLAAPREEQGGLLLDLLALTDAVVYTQGVSRADGALEPLPPGCGVYLPLSYSQLNPLLAALTGKGGGRQSQVKDIWEAQPAFFGDYRVLPALISGLGDSYGELAELNAQILKGLGPAPLPLLKEGFDPAGKKDMARRVEVIAAIEGTAATPWLREVLPQSKKSVRAAVIEALGEDYQYAEGKSCDYDGLDKTYTYEAATFYTNPLAEGDLLAEIYSESPEAVTSKGISSGASKADVLAAYGDPAEQDEYILIYRASEEIGSPSLCFELDGDTVTAVFLTVDPV